MPRRLNVPELLDARAGETAAMVWDFYGDVYPESIAARLDITTHPDPFSPGTQRVCHHAAAQLWGLGVVDLGWCVTGEPDPEPAICAVMVDPRLMLTLRDSFGDTEGRDSARGAGVQNNMWRAYYHVVRLTMLGLTVELVRRSTRHRATDAFTRSAQNADYGGGRMMVAWPGYSGIDLRTF